MELLSDRKCFAAWGELGEFAAKCGGRDKVICWVLEHRDSGPIDRSNAATIRKRIPEGPDAFYGRCDHWAVGWTEELFVREGSEAAAELERIEDELEGYPILNEILWSEMEFDDSLKCLHCYVPRGVSCSVVDGHEGELREILDAHDAEYDGDSWHLPDEWGGKIPVAILREAGCQVDD